MTPALSKKKQQTVSKSVFKAKALEFFRQVEETGEPILISHRGRPVLELRPIRRESADKILARLRGCIVSFERPLDPVGVQDWEALGD